MADVPSTTPIAVAKGRRWRQFSLRACFVVITIVACISAWFGDEIARHRREQAAIGRLTIGGNITVHWASRFERHSPRALNPQSGIFLLEKPGVFNRFRNIETFRTVKVFACHPEGNTFAFDVDRDNRLLIKRDYIAGLRDGDMAAIKDLVNLQTLWLEANGISDEGLKELRGLESLEILWLAYTAVTDTGISMLAEFPLLQDLDLSGTYVTDRAIPVLSKSRKLEHLVLRNTNVTEEGLVTLQRELPNCRIEH
jgi:hypothetical protein